MTDRHINYESKHGTLKVPDYAKNPNAIMANSVPKLRFYGLNTAIDHKSKTQLQGWKDVMAKMYTVYNASPLGRRKPLNPLEFPRLVKGMNTDHAEDQKKLVRLFASWKETCEYEVRGEEALLSASIAELIPLLWVETERNIQAVGGLAAWNALSEDDQMIRKQEAYKRACLHIGKELFEQLTPNERRHAVLFIWGGCCMHKEMNTIKWGNLRFRIFWLTVGVAPMKLMNRDNAAAAALGGQAAADRAEEVSQAGGVKLTSLAGAVFAHKDKKKGQQDSLRYWIESCVGYMIRFPDTSNTRYQSHCEAAAELLVRLHFYRDYLEVVRDLKESGTWTNIEKNVYDGLHDIPTLTELAVLVLYSQAVSHPYMRLVRGSEAASTNLLDLGPVHERVKNHCQAVIANPNLLLAPDATYTAGAMDGKTWERSDAFYAVKALSQSLPHLCGALVAFFEGALEGWE